jgi:hypothetical protein
VVWDSCHGERQIGPISGILYRLVESQEHIATLNYVDSLEEQALLEEMLEAVKPPYPDNSQQYHYLLRTPFRYPPLPWGSRFGRPHEPSIFYAGSNTHVALAESAYYRFIFWYSMDAVAIKDKIRTEHTLFSVGYHTDNGIQLQHPPFDQHHADITHPKHYLSSQLLGSAMRESSVEVFEYPSARDPDKGHCVGLFTPTAFARKQPKDKNQWLCEVSASEVSFKQIDSSGIKTYPITDFYYDKQLPLPA